MTDPQYDELIDIEKIKEVYHTIKVNTKHKAKIMKFEIFLASNLMVAYNKIRDRDYVHGKYNVFFVTLPKCRIIMSENMYDKIVNHLVSKYVLFPIIEPKLIETNVATRTGKGTKKAIYYMKKYINSLKENNEKIYVLKCDIRKYFYSIDHDMLLSYLKPLIKDEDIFQLVKEIVCSTDKEYINEEINSEIKRVIKKTMKSNMTSSEKKHKIQELNNLPRYIPGKGLPIGNMSSQIMAIFYLNELDHFIKEKLRIRHYIRYMDDLILLHPDKEYLKYCLKEINKRVQKLLLNLNEKTQIYEIHNGVPFLGYKFKLTGKRLHLLINSSTKRRIIKKINKCKKNKLKMKEQLIAYYGYLKSTDSKSFIYNIIGNVKISNKGK